MLETILQNKKLIIVISVAIVILLIVFGLVQSMTFHVTSADPASNGTITSLTKTVVLSFNKDLAAFDRTTQISGGDGIVSGSKIDGKKLYIQLSSMSDGQAYTLTFSGITATDGSTIETYIYSFKYAFDPNASSANEKGTDDPLVKYLPVTTDQYNISYELLDQPTPDGKTTKLYVTLLVPDSENSDVEKVRSYKKAALDYLSSKDILLGDYIVVYTPTEAAQY